MALDITPRQLALALPSAPCIEYLPPLRLAMKNCWRFLPAREAQVADLAPSNGWVESVVGMPRSFAVSSPPLPAASPRMTCTPRRPAFCSRWNRLHATHQTPPNTSSAARHCPAPGDPSALLDSLVPVRRELRPALHLQHVLAQQPTDPWRAPKLQILALASLWRPLLVQSLASQACDVPTTKDPAAKGHHIMPA